MKTPPYLLMLVGFCLLAGACTAEDLSEDLIGDQFETSGDTPEGADPDSDDTSNEEATDEDTASDNTDDASNDGSGGTTGDDTTDGASGDGADSGSGDSGTSGDDSTSNDDTTTNNDSTSNDGGTTGGDGTSSCGPSSYVFKESGGVLLAEMEDAAYSGAWKESGNGGTAYLHWTGSQYFNNPGNGKIRYQIEINTPGTYLFTWRTAVTIGSNGTEHNDTWLRFPDASDFYGEKNGSVVYPAGIGKSPNPKGASSDGWFKVYRSGNDLGFKWQARTSDHDAHDIYVTFNSPGVYVMEVSARSTGHAIDRFALIRQGVDADAALNGGLSAISCGN